MIKGIHIKQYRKLKNIDIDFSNAITVISGTNGTCKSSLLYLVSNSFQEVKTTAPWLKDDTVIKNIKSINSGINLKIESLTKGDEKYNDPAKGEKGTLFSCDYENGDSLEFRRHNTRKKKDGSTENRFALKPQYKRGEKEKLPQCMVIYLGLARLYAYGEYNQEIAKIRQSLPDEYFEIIREIYKSFTGVVIENEEMEAMKGIKRRAKFSTNIEGIDSNTISAGEDNLLIIITALVSLRYYYENITPFDGTNSILLIDEMDATLHPAYQYKLMDLFNQYATAYHIKFVFTSHSLSLLEYAYEKKNKVIYLLDNITAVKEMEDSDIYKIKMYLRNKTKEDIYLNRCIPVFAEDNEARTFVKCLFDYYDREYGADFKKVRSLFHFVEANVSGDALKSIFKDNQLTRSTMRSICILDGDKRNDADLQYFMTALPGTESPEKMMFDYAIELFENDNDFWMEQTILDLGYTRVNFRDEIKPDIDAIYEKVKKLKDEGKSTKGVIRQENKDTFNRHGRFFELIMRKWIIDHPTEVGQFYKNLHTLFCKVAEFHDISSSDWNYTGL
jgi:AAA15 family ATPase/GTPase